MQIPPVFDCFSRYSDEQKGMEIEKTLNVAPN